MESIYANKTILSAGAIGSSQALMLSGIGNFKDLKDLDIKPILELPVGENLQDHSEVYLQYKCNTNKTLYPYGTWKKPITKILAGVEWFTSGKGVCSSNQFDVGGFINSDNSIEHPDIQYHFIPGAVLGQLEFVAEDAFQVHIGPLRPTSRGTVKLKTKNPLDAPLIDPNYYASEYDLEIMHKALIKAKEIVNQPAFDQHRGNIIEPQNLNLNDKKSTYDWIKQNSHSAYHLSCTCAMGQVVDSEANVYGCENLKIIDASIMPSMTSGNLNAPTIMMAEKLSSKLI